MVKVNMTQREVVKLTPVEVKKLSQIINQYAHTPTQKLKVQILDAFTPYIEKIAETASKSPNFSIKDYIQNLYLNILENLDEIVKTKPYKVAALSKLLNNTKITIDDLILTTKTNIENITEEEEEASDLSCQMTDNNLIQKTWDIINLCKKGFTAEEETAIAKTLEGYSFAEIGEELFTTPKNDTWTKSEKARKAYTSALIKIAHSPYRAEVNDIFYDNNIKTEKATQPGKNNHKLRDRKLTEQYVPTDDLKDAFEKLDNMLKVQYFSRRGDGTSWGTLLHDKKMQREVLDLSIKNPNFRITLYLHNDPRTFIPAAERISEALFGKNLFNFIYPEGAYDKSNA